MPRFAAQPAIYKGSSIPGKDEFGPWPGDLWVDLSVPALKRMSSVNPDVWVSVESGGGGPTFADAEVPSGAINGSNVTYTLSFAPSPAGSLLLFRNGLLQTGGAVDYTLSGSTITMVTAPLTGDSLIGWYRH